MLVCCGRHNVPSACNPQSVLVVGHHGGWRTFLCHETSLFSKHVPTVDSRRVCPSLVNGYQRILRFVSGFEEKHQSVVHSSLSIKNNLQVCFEIMTTLQQQAHQSGLAFADFSDTPQWNVNDWPPLLGGWRSHHASVVLDHPEQDNAQMVVVLGGNKQEQGFINSVFLLSLTKNVKQWREGPPLNDKRGCHAAVVCSGGVYVIGGYNGNSNLDSVERIAVADLCSGSLTRSACNPWTTLSCRLSTARHGCSAVTIYNRYIVVIGGDNGNCLPLVDIIDTAVPSNHTVIVGPSMTVPRQGFASAVIGHRIFVVGGRNGTDLLTSVEHMEFHCLSGNEKLTTANAVFPSSCGWTSHNDLSVPRWMHGVVAVGSCLIVLGGFTEASTAEVLDTRRNTVWTLPRSSGLRFACCAVVHSKGIAVIGGSDNASCETLSLIDKNSRCFGRLMELAPSTIFGSRTNSLGLASDCAKELKEPNERPKKKLATGKSATEKVS